MSHVRALWLKFHAELLVADVVAAARVRDAGCSRCEGGRLAVSNYPRKARGLDEEVEREGRYGLRLSFCCSREGCRRRTTPPSVRFLGRRVFTAAVVLLAMSSTGLPAPATPPPARQTRRRWCAFWQVQLFSSALFTEMIASRVGEVLEPTEMPSTLIERFDGDLLSRSTRALRLLAPWTTSSTSPESARLAMAP